LEQNLRTAKLFLNIFKKVLKNFSKQKKGNFETKLYEQKNYKRNLDKNF
jgi:hypothetical protein